MTVTINGTTGIAGVDGSAGTPAIQGGDTNTGMFFPAADTAAIATGGVERMRIDSSGNQFNGGTTQNTSTAPVYASNTAKAWVNFSGATPTISGSFNVSSVTRPSTGSFVVSFTSALANANYAATANSWQSTSNSGVAYNVISLTTTSYQISCYENNAVTNPTRVYSIVFGT
jgi:hypothetical protein